MNEEDKKFQKRMFLFDLLEFIADAIIYMIH